MIHLLDANALIALLAAEHEHHDAIEGWITQVADFRFATCPITEGSLVRYFFLNKAKHEIEEALARIYADSRHVFWPDAIDYRSVEISNLSGHKQVTDAYLAQLARQHRGKVATFDVGMALQHPDVVILLTARS